MFLKINVTGTQPHSLFYVLFVTVLSHKGRIENFVTETEGPMKSKILAI